MSEKVNSRAKGYQSQTGTLRNDKHVSPSGHKAIPSACIAHWTQETYEAKSDKTNGRNNKAMTTGRDFNNPENNQPVNQQGQRNFTPLASPNNSTTCFLFKGLSSSNTGHILSQKTNCSKFKMHEITQNTFLTTRNHARNQEQKESSNFPNTLLNNPWVTEEVLKEIKIPTSVGQINHHREGLTALNAYIKTE